MDKVHCYKVVVSASLLMLCSAGIASPPITVTDGTTRVKPSAGITIAISTAGGAAALQHSAGVPPVTDEITRLGDRLYQVCIFRQ